MPFLQLECFIRYPCEAPHIRLPFAIFLEELRRLIFGPKLGKRFRRTSTSRSTPMALAPSNIDPDHLVLYAYKPSAVAAGIFMGIFGVATVAHIFYLPKLRQCFFIPMILGGISTS